MQPRTRRATILLFGLSALALAACQPAAAPPPQGSGCATATNAAGSTRYFAVVDDGTRPGRVVPFDASSEAEKQADVAAIEQTQGPVVDVEVDQPVVATAIDDPDTVAGNQWGIASAGFEAAWANAGSKGAGVTVAVLDTGSNAAHEDLAWTGATPGYANGADFVDGSIANGQDDPSTSSHGTHVSGIIAERDNNLGGIGGAPEATIMPVRVLDVQGSGTYSQVISGMQFAIANGADIISMSLGGASYSQALENQVNAAVNAGVSVIAAAGNNGTCDASYPGALSNVIAVAATQQSPPDSLAPFSERGSWVEIAAPGAGIWSTVKDTGSGKYGYKSGTSMATPYVSAAAALLIAKCGSTWAPSAVPGQVATHLEQTSAPIAGNPILTGALRADAATAAPC
jgi:subtilisin family serine protease